MDKRPYRTKNYNPDGTSPEIVDESAAVLKKLDELDSEEETKDEANEDVKPGPIHSALGNAESVAAAPDVKEDEKVIVNPHTNPRTDVESDHPAGWPVFTTKKDPDKQ